jgi:hypothetical protein
MRMAAAEPIAGQLSQLLLDSDGILAGNPSFDLSYPKIPGRDVEGIPNANEPEMRRKLMERFLRNPDGGQELPGFIKKAAAESPYQRL